MNKLLLSVLAAGAASILVAVLVVFSSYVSYSNLGNSYEQRLEAKWQDNQNVLGQYTIRVAEMAQVPEMYRDDLKEVIAATFEGRYGADGSRATFQWIQEQNLQFDSSMYNRLQQTMEAGRLEFANRQTELIDIKRAYQTDLGNVWSGLWLSFAGYPKADLEKYKPVIAAGTAETFRTGVDAGMTLRPKAGVE